MSLFEGTPGRRFSAHYRHRRRHHGQWLRAFSIAAGATLMAVGALLLLTPGPGLLALLAGAAILARESPRAARTFDRLEVQVRSWLRIRRLS